MKRGEVWWTDFDPSMGSEIQKTRPVVIVSNDRSNARVDRVQVVPVSSQSEKLYPSEALVWLQGKACKAMADQIRTVSKHRVKSRITQLSSQELEAIGRAIKIQLNLP